VEQSICITFLRYWIFSLYFPRNILYFRPPSFSFVLLEAVISIIEQRGESSDKRVFLIERRCVFVLALWTNRKTIPVLLSMLVKSSVTLLYLNKRDTRVGSCPDLIILCYISVVFPLPLCHNRCLCWINHLLFFDFIKELRYEGMEWFQMVHLESRPRRLQTQCSVSSVEFVMNC